MKQVTTLDDGSTLVEHFKIKRDGSPWLASEILESQDKSKSIKRYYRPNGKMKREVVDDGGILTVINWDERGGSFRERSTSDGRRRRKQATQDAGGISAKAPAVVTNSIPGQPSRITFDELTGQEFSSRGKYEEYLEKNNLAEVDAKSVPVPPSEATCPTRPNESKFYTHGTHITGLRVNDSGSPDFSTVQSTFEQDVLRGDSWHKSKKGMQRSEFKRQEKIKLKKGIGI